MSMHAAAMSSPRTGASSSRLIDSAVATSAPIVNSATLELK